MSFNNLGNVLGNALNQAIVPGESGVSSLAADGKPYGALGAFADRIDKTAQRTYIEDGFVRNVRPRGLEVLMQQPDITVVIKKRMFSSLAESYRSDYMNDQEKLFTRAAKKLFANKCAVISAYEKLSKIDRITGDTGVLNTLVVPQVVDGLNALDQASTLISGKNLLGQNTRATVDILRKLNAFSDVNAHTTWINDHDATYVSDTGEGTGVIELTTVTNISTTVSTEYDAGSCSFTLEDPYKLMIITNDDIDKAISDAASIFSNSSFFQFSLTKLEDLVGTNQLELNNLRSMRYASPIKWISTPESIISKKLRAVIDTEGREINFTFQSTSLGFDSDVTIDPSALTGKNGLTPPEVDIFKRTVSNSYKLMALRESTRSQVKDWNERMSYVRNKMRLHFANKPIIQPMDVVHIFMSSKSNLDDRISSPAVQNTGADIISGINRSLKGLSEGIADINAMFGGGSRDADQIEKAANVGAQFPTWLWKLLRNDFTRQAAGVSVFAGLVTEAPHSYSASEGKYTLNVSCEDNTHYFSKSKININPSIDVWNGPLYDPITPFNISFDEGTGFENGKTPQLLDENINLLNSGLIRFPTGGARGEIASVKAFAHGDVEPSGQVFRKVVTAPNGFVYRWKEGIGTYVKFAPGSQTPSTTDETVKITKNPYAGQDIMNVLSLLITGTPYNFNTFLKAAVDSGHLNRNDLTNESLSKSFYRGLIDDISRTNQTWGNFVPFKKLVVNDAAYSMMASGQETITKQNALINSLLADRADLFDKLTQATSEFAKSPQIFKFNTDLTLQGNVSQSVLNLAGQNAALNNVVIQIAKLDLQIQAAKDAFVNFIDKNNLGVKSGQIKIFGDDISFGDPAVGGANSTTHQQAQRDREDLRKKLNYFTQRRLWRVKANEDPNYFIVDDTYDKDYDIQAFEKGISSNLELFNSDFTTVSDQIGLVKSLLGFEVFADSQGHIHARAPQYNKVPSSVFYDMFRNRFKTGVRVFPKFLEKLYLNQFERLSTNLEIIEDEIRLRAAVLGYSSDTSVAKFLSGYSGGQSGSGFYDFVFTTNDDNGKLGGKDIRVLLQTKNADLDEAINSNALKPVSDKVNSALKSVRNFDITQKITVFTAEFKSAVDNARIDQVRARIKEKTGNDAKTVRELLSDTRIGTSTRSQSDILKITNEISQFISERQTIITTIANSIKNIDQGVKLNSGNKGATAALFPFMTSVDTHAEIPQILEHLIEDEEYDDLGPGSGARYVIKDHQILSLRISEKAPLFTAISVNGLFGQGLAAPVNEFTYNSSGGGNFVTSAAAVDYDMWRMYGFRGERGVPAPFFNDPTTQCAPYAVFLLNKARKEIFTGNVEIVGNEYMQAGEVVYIEDRDLLFYITSVRHNFNYSGQFTTGLELTFGHNPGEYIPTTLDIVGKALYNSKHDVSNYRTARFDDNANGEVSLNAIAFDGRAPADENTLNNIMTGRYADQNRKTLTNALVTLGGIFNPTNLNKVPKLYIRTYSFSIFGLEASVQIKMIADAIKNWFKHPLAGNTFGNSSLLPADVNIGIDIKDRQIVVETIDLSSMGKSTGVISKDAMHVARTLANDTSSFTSKSDVTQVSPEFNAIAGGVIDIWVAFENPVSTTATQTPGQSTDNQNIQEKMNQLAVQLAAAQSAAAKSADDKAKEAKQRAGVVIAQHFK